MGPGNGAQVLWKSCQRSSPLSRHLCRPHWWVLTTATKITLKNVSYTIIRVNNCLANSYWVSVVDTREQVLHRGTGMSLWFSHVSVDWQWQTPSVDHDTLLQCSGKDGQGFRLSSQRFPSITFGTACLPGGVLSPLILPPALSCMQISLKHWSPLAQLQVPCGCVFCMQNTTTKVFRSF